MKYTEEIFNLLSRGGFISSNSVSAQTRRLYDAIEDNFDDYYDYFSGIGFLLQAGDSYYYFARREPKAEIQRKLEQMLKWIDYLDFLKTFNSTFGPGFEFRPADILVRFNSDLELEEKARHLFKEKMSHEELVDKLVKELTDMGFTELENEIDRTYKVTSAFHYIENLIDSITVADEVQNEIP